MGLFFWSLSSVLLSLLSLPSCIQAMNHHENDVDLWHFKTVRKGKILYPIYSQADGLVETYTKAAQMGYHDTR